MDSSEAVAARVATMNERVQQQTIEEASQQQQQENLDQGQQDHKGEQSQLPPHPPHNATRHQVQPPRPIHAVEAESLGTVVRTVEETATRLIMQHNILSAVSEPTADHNNQAASTSSSSSRTTPISAAIMASAVAQVEAQAAAESSSTSQTEQELKYDKCPAIIRVDATKWESWLEGEMKNCRWNLLRHRHRDKQTFARGPTASEWSRGYQCEHAGHYRDRRDPDMDEKKKRKRGESIKCGCPAFIKMRKQFQDADVVIEYFWKHVGHVPNVMEDIKAQRLPQDLKLWIKRRVQEGLDWKALKRMMLTGSPALEELQPATRDNIKMLIPSTYAQYANSARQFLKKNSRSPSAQPSSEKPSRGGTLMHFGSGDEGMPLSHVSQSSSPDPTSESSSQRHSNNNSSAHLPGPKPSQQAAWQLVGLNPENHPTGHSHGFTGSQDQPDSQTLAVRSLPSRLSTAHHAPNHLTQHSTHKGLTLSEPLAATLSRALQEQHGHQQQHQQKQQHEQQKQHEQQPSQGMTALSLVDAAKNLSSPNTPPHDSDGHDSDGAAEVARRVLMATNAVMARREDNPEQTNAGNPLAEQPRQPRDMMREMLSAIADLHKRMEATDQFGTQEDATEIIESFALPIRLMKEALERASRG